MTNLDSLAVSGPELPNSGSTNDTYIIDSGTSTTYSLPLADATNTAFIPPATCSDTLGYSVNCSAVLPDVGIEIGGVVLDMDPRVLMSKNTDTDENVHCVPTTYGLIVPNGFSPVKYILGVWNWGLRFAQRK